MVLIDLRFFDFAFGFAQNDKVYAFGFAQNDKVYASGSAQNDKVFLRLFFYYIDERKNLASAFLGKLRR